MKQEYGANQIQVLEGLEAVRLRPGMYIGSTGPRGLHHLVYELWITVSTKLYKDTVTEYMYALMKMVV